MNLSSRVKISNVNFRKSVVLWANSGGGDVTSEHYVDTNKSRSLYVDTSGEEGEMTSISSGVKNTPYFLRTNQLETPHD